MHTSVFLTHLVANMRCMSILFLLLLAPLIQARLASDCRCGYHDATSNALWTDVIITYFNETSSIVTNPTVSPYIQGQSSAGNTGNGTQDWSAVGDQTDDYEDAFGATYRSAVLYNNTLILNNELEMRVEPADSKNRIVYGAEFVTRRRDILYGSFRASMSLEYVRNSGTGFQMSAMYNDSETVDLSLFSSDTSNDSTLQWSYSARDTDAEPVLVPFSTLKGASSDGFLEHRFDWKSDSILYSNNNSNIEASSLLVTQNNSHTIPSTPVPISFRHWSDGNPQSTQGPPLNQAKTGRIRYVRFFFNSSLPSRQEEFTLQCSSSSVAACSTEDSSLRGSTAFSQSSTLKLVPVKVIRVVPRYSVYGMTISGGLFLILIIHGFVKNVFLRRASSSQMDKVDSYSSDSATITCSKEDTKETVAHDNDVEFNSDLNSRNGLTRWNPAFFTQAQLEEDSDDNNEMEEMTDDEDFMQDQQEETDITNDDGLGRPDRIQFHSHPHSIPDLPQHRHPLGVSDFTTQLDPFMDDDSAFSSDAFINGDVIPTLPSKMTLAFRQNEDEKSLSRQQQPPSAWRSSIQGAPSLSSGNLTTLFDPGYTMHSSIDCPMPVCLTDAHSRKSATNSTFTLLSERAEEKTIRKSSVASLNAIVMVNTTLSEAPPSISIWNRMKNDGDVMAARTDEKKQLPVTDSKPWWKAAFEYIFILEGGTSLTASGAARVSYLEGLRGFACFLVSLNHFMLMFWFAATTEGAPTHTNGFELWFYRIISPVFFNQGTKIGIFFVLPARVMGTRYMLRGKLQDVADSTLRRVPRLAFPTFAAVLINYFFIQVDAYQWVRRLPSRTWSIWAYYQDFDSIGSFINAWIGLWFTLPPQNPVLLSTYATGVLWTIPVITQSSFAVLITVIVSKELANVYKRYGFYLFAMVSSWYANRFDYYFIAGLVIADMDNKLKYRKAAARGIPIIPRFISPHLPSSLQHIRVHGQIIGWFLFLGGSLVQYLEYLDLPGRHFNIWEYGILPDFTTAQPRVWVQHPLIENYNDPRFSLFCMVIGIFVLCDLSKTFAGFFMLRWWAALGRNGFSLYLLHGTIFWTWGAWLCIQLLKIGTPYWAAVTVVFLTSYFILAIVCELFTRTFDAWGVSMSKALWRYTSDGLGRRDGS